MQKSDNNYAKKILKWKTNKPQILSMVSKIQIIFGAKPHICKKKKVQNSSTQIHAIVSKMTDFLLPLQMQRIYGKILQIQHSYTLIV